MRLLAGLVAAGVILLAGCDSGGGGSDPKPKGEKPEITTAPPDAKTPEQRGMEGGNKSTQDGGGQDGK